MIILATETKNRTQDESEASVVFRVAEPIAPGTAIPVSVFCTFGLLAY